MGKFAIVTEEGNETSKVGSSEEDAVWQKDRNLVLIYTACKPEGMRDDLLGNILTVMAKIAKFLWGRIAELERGNKELKNEINELRKALSQATNVQ